MGRAGAEASELVEGVVSDMTPLEMLYVVCESSVPAITAYYRDSLLPQLHLLSSASVLLTINQPLNSLFFPLVWVLRGSA